ncbi:MAG TPA: anhydro-N-acetylmuramic acid kinase [bacterium]|nr:anhydro-N-acetylmuramic acid kinase [bacterium]
MGWPWLDALLARPVKRIIGLISGTSADGIATAVADVADGAADGFPRVTLRGFVSHPFPEEVRARVLRACVEPLTTQALASLSYLLGELFADAAREAVRTAGIGLEDVDLIASHGQTVAHVGVPDSADRWARAATMQIAEPAVIAARTGRPVIADFRAADIAAGGQAAPFVPYADLMLLGGPVGRIALNLGGIANFTVLPPNPRRDDVYAFDCGPANMVIDGLVRHFTGGAERFDRDGRRAARGHVREDVLAALMRDPFVTAAPPKTAGHEQFGQAFLRTLLSRWGDVPPDDLIATATAFSADAVAWNIAQYVTPSHTVDELVASGGGTHNPVLMDRLARAVAPIRVRRIDEFGVPGDAKEALAFALLGHASLVGRPGALPRVTGARYAAVLGTWTWPPAAAGDAPTRPAGR